MAHESRLALMGTPDLLRGLVHKEPAGDEQRDELTTLSLPRSPILASSSVFSDESPS